MALTDGLYARARAQGLRLGPTQEAALLALGALRDGPVDGVYLHGPAGRGKTWLLDAVVQCSAQPVQRYHGNAFFTRLDTELGRRLTAPDGLPAGTWSRLALLHPAQGATVRA